MVAKVLSLDAAREKKRCRRSDGSLPERTDRWRPRPDARLSRALAAVAALDGATFEEKVAVFRRVWQMGVVRGIDGVPGR